MGPLIGLLAGSAIAGLAVGAALGGASELALLVGLATPPIGLGAAVAAWRSVVGAWFVGRLARSALRSGGDDERFRDETKRSFAEMREAGPGALPGGWVVLPAVASVGLVGAAVMALVGGWLAGVALFGVTVAEGIVLRRMARTGGLLLPE